MLRTRKFRKQFAGLLAVALEGERQRNYEVTQENARLKRELDQSQTAVAFLVKGRCDAPHFPSDN